MRLYADSAALDDVLPLVRDRLVAGVTTNPTIIARDGHTSGDRARLFKTFDDAGAPEIFMQAVGGSREAMLADGVELAGLGTRMCVKVPATPDGFAVARALVSEGVPVLVTAVYSVAQAAFAASVGARFIAPYYARLVDSGENALDLIARMNKALEGSGTDALVASVRSAEAGEELIGIGVRYITANVPVLREMMSHPVSDASAAEFERIAAEGA